MDRLPKKMVTDLVFCSLLLYSSWGTLSRVQKGHWHELVAVLSSVPLGKGHLLDGILNKQVPEDRSGLPRPSGLRAAGNTVALHLHRTDSEAPQATPVALLPAPTSQPRPPSSASSPEV